MPLHMLSESSSDWLHIRPHRIVTCQPIQQSFESKLRASLSNSTKMHFGVIGSGVVGLCTALQLQEDFRNAKVTIIADKFGKDTTR